MSQNYTSTYLLNNVLQALLLVVWLLAALTVTSLVRRKTERGLTIFGWLAFGLIIVATGGSLFRAINMAGLAANGFDLVPLNTLTSLPLFLLPLIFTIIWTLPRLWRIVRSRKKVTAGPLQNQNEVIDQRPIDKAEIAAPELVVPVQAGAMGAFLAVLVLFIQPVLSIGVAGLVLFAAFVAWRWWQQLQLQNRLQQNETKAIPRYWIRLAQSTGFVVLVAAILAAWALISLQTSRLAPSYNMMQDMGGDAQSMAGMKMLNVTDLTGPKDRAPDQKFTLTAQKFQVQLSSGQTTEVWGFNGQVPGPELRVHQGDLVEVELKNQDVEEGVTIHWHGVDVPNAEDGVAGLTQNAVMPGQTFTYRFVAKDTGTYWYHSHQLSLEQVKKGLFGAFIVEPKQAETGIQDITLAAHTWQTKTGTLSAWNLATGLGHRMMAPGAPVRLRLINTDNKPLIFSLSGVPFQVSAIDGIDLNQPTDLKNTRLTLAAGGRYDLRFTMPNSPVLLDSPGASLALSPDGKAEIASAKDLVDFNPASYGQAAPTPFGPASHFDREYTFDLESGLGFYDGAFGPVWMINGQVFPDIPAITVKEGELIKIKFINRTVQAHPMHPHGHKMLVLSRNGQPVTGSPWWTDTLNVAPGEIIEVALKADNPGLWMDHCHDLEHAAGGMVMHLMYEGVMTPFLAGSATHNSPE